MPFLLGMFGQEVKILQDQHFAAVIEKYAQKDTITKNIFKNGMLYVGHAQNEAVISDPIIVLPNQQGFFVGKLFDKHNFSPVTFTTTQADAIIQDSKIIMQQWWGRYVAMLYNNTTQQCTLIRDPQGLSTVFYASINNNVVFSTDLSLLYDVLEEKPALNEIYFTEYISGVNYASALTPFKGILELLPGMSLQIQSDGKFILEQLWNVSDYGGSFIKDVNAFEEELLHTLQSCLKAWVGSSNGVCLELSGGTDSSGLMILLRNILPEHKNIIGVNYIDSKAPSSNEIEYAQEVADMCNTQLHFLDWQDSSLLDPLPHAWRPNKPTTFLMFYKTTQQLHDFAVAHGCHEIMNGQGGDHVFLAPQPVDSLADYWLDKGLRGITKPLKELSATHRMPWWMIIRDAMSNLSNYYGIYNKKVKKDAENIYFTPAFAYKPDDNDFYLKDSVAQFYPAKKDHVKSLFHGISYADRNQRIIGKNVTHPLLSQPIVELALRIPTYQSFNNGFDRIFFRNSVSRIQKPRALWRTIKGETNSSMAKSFSMHAADVQDMILSGYFNKHGIINKQWFMQEMAKVRHGHINNLWPIMRFLVAQRWLDQWNL